jgi:hypothetical protein
MMASSGIKWMGKKMNGFIAFKSIATIGRNCGCVLTAPSERLYEVGYNLRQVLVSRRHVSLLDMETIAAVDMALR